MKKYEELFFLIKSLSRSEKRYFKVFSQLHELGGTTNNYVLLFDAIEKMEIYDEKKLITQFTKNGKQSELSTKKNQLFGKVLEAMQMYHKEQKSAIKVNELLSDARFLFDRGIIGTAIKKLEKITENPQNNNHRIVLDACHLSRSLIMRFEGKDKATKLKKIQKLEKEFVENEVLLNKLLHIWDEVYLLLSKEYQNSKQIKNQKLEEIKGEFAKIKEEDCQTFQTKKYFYVVKGGISLLVQDLKLTLTYYQNVVELYQVNNQWKKKEPTEYFAAIHNYLAICEGLQEYDLMIQEIEFLKSIKAENLLLEAKLFYTINNMELVCFANTHQFQKGEALIISIEKGIKKYGNLIPKEHLISIYYTLMCLFFRKESFIEVLVWCEKIQNLGIHSPRYDVQDAIHVFLMISYYELENYDELINQMRRTKRYYKKHKRNGELGLRVIKLIQESIKLTSKKELIHLRKVAHSDILMNSYRKNIGANDVLIWLNSKILGQTMVEIVEKELSNKPI